MSRKFQIRPTTVSATFCGREYELHGAAVLELQHIMALLDLVRVEFRRPSAGSSPDPRSCPEMKVTSAVGSSAAISSGGMPHSFRYWSLMPVMSPSLEMTTNPVGGGFQRGVQQGDGQAAAGIGVLAVAAVPDGDRHGRAAVERYERAGDLQGQFAAVPTAACRRERPAAGQAAAAQPAEDPEEAAALVLGEQDGVLGSPATARADSRRGARRRRSRRRWFRPRSAAKQHRDPAPAGVSSIPVPTAIPAPQSYG